MPCDSTPRSFAALMVRSPGQLRADDRQRALESGARVARAADDLQRLAAAACETLQTCSLSACGCALGAEDLRHDDAGEWRRRGSSASSSKPAMVSRAPSSRALPRHARPTRQARSKEIFMRSKRPELPQETQVVLEEQAQVVHAVTQHREPVDARAEGIAGVALRIDAAGLAARSDAPCRSRRSRASRSACRCGSPCPSQNTQDMSTSADGSVKGKYEGRRRIARSCSKNACRKPCSTAFMLAKLTSSPTTSPSSWWNIGECVMSESLRYTRPGAMTASGAPCAEHGADLHRRGVRAQQAPVGEIEGVVHRPRRMIGRDVERLEIVEVIFDLGPAATSKPARRNSVSMRRRALVTGCRPPALLAASREA